MVPNYFPSGYAFTEEYAYYYVPPPPTYDGDDQHIFIFPAFQSSGNEVIQPMLYNNGDGTGWGIAPWYFYRSQNWIGQTLPVQPGDEVFVYAATWSSANIWYEYVYDFRTNQSANNLYSEPNSVVWSFPTAMEAYSVDFCHDLPNTSSMEFFNINVFDGPTWSTRNNVTALSGWYPQWQTGESPNCYFYNVAGSNGGEADDIMFWTPTP